MFSVDYIFCYNRLLSSL